MDVLVLAVAGSMLMTAYKDMAKTTMIDKVNTCIKTVDMVERERTDMTTGQLFSVCYEKGPSAILVKKNLE